MNNDKLKVIINLNPLTNFFFFLIFLRILANVQKLIFFFVCFSYNQDKSDRNQENCMEHAAIIATTGFVLMNKSIKELV